MDMNLSWCLPVQETVKDREALCAAVHGVGKSQIWLNDWPTGDLIQVEPTQVIPLGLTA